MDKIKNYIKEQNLIKHGDGIVVAFSGGPDSMYLLRKLLQYREEWDLKLAAVHINHGLLDDAKEQAEFARDFCVKHQVPFYLFEADILAYAKQQKMSVEEAGRKFRYEKFYEVRKELSYTSIAVAHHLDDRAETVLYRMARGTGWKGMAGIRAKQNKIIRPLLEVSKREILHELERWGQDYNYDPSNQDTHYARNRVRHLILPELANVNHKAAEHIASLAEQMQEVGEYLEWQILQAVNDCVDQKKERYEIKIKAFQTYPAFMQKEVIKYCLEKVAGSQKDLKRVHIAHILELKDRQTGRTIDLPYEVQAMRQYDAIILQKKQKTIEEKIELLGEGNYEVPFANGRLKVSVLKNDEEILEKIYTKTFDYDKIKEKLIVRTYEPGDYFIMNKKGQQKKLNRFYIDRKIPAPDRVKIPLIAMGQHILWVIGERTTYEYRVTEDTKKVLKLEWMQMEEE